MQMQNAYPERLCPVCLMAAATLLYTLSPARLGITTKAAPAQLAAAIKAFRSM